MVTFSCLLCQHVHSLHSFMTFLFPAPVARHLPAAAGSLPFHLPPKRRKFCQRARVGTASPSISLISELTHNLCYVTFYLVSKEEIIGGIEYTMTPAPERTLTPPSLEGSPQIPSKPSLALQGIAANMCGVSPIRRRSDAGNE
jgi:hypothetical protein